MLDISRGEIAALTPLPPIEFLRIELAPMLAGTVRVSFTATTVDDAAELPELLDEEIAEQQVTSMEELLALIRTHVHIGTQTAPTLAN